MATYRQTYNPATGEWIQFEKTGLETDGELVRYRWKQDPGGHIVEHFHPYSSERFIIESGKGEFTVDGEMTVYGAGDTVDIPAPHLHEIKNPGPEPMVGWVELSPARMTAELHDTLAGLSSEGMTDDTGKPKNPLQMGSTFWYFRNDIRATSVPVWLQNVMLPPLAGLARLFGIKPTYPRWSSREGDASEEGTG
jgi:quercetin dioxygenase-like cupin family protein